MRVLQRTLVALALVGCAAPAALPSPPPTQTPAPTEAVASSMPLVPATPEPTLAPPPSLPPACRQPAPAQLVAYCPDGATIWMDTALSRDDMSAITAQVEADLAAVQTEFAWHLQTRAVIFVRATRDGYVDTLEHEFGYGAAAAEYVADNSVAFFEPSLREIAVNWEEVRDRRPIAAIRHELTHVVTLEACAPRCDLVPAWLNEGEARLMETTVGAAWRLMRVRYEASSMAATSTLLPLTSLWTQAQWNAYGDWLGYYKYQEAARATELLRADIGDDPMPRLYALLRAGRDVPSAYATLSGKSFASFTATLETRIRGDLPPRGIVTTTPGADGTGVSYLVYGFAPEAQITLRIRSHAVDETRSVQVSPQGALFDSIGDTYPPGAYTITAESGGGAVSVNANKRGGRFTRTTQD